MAPAHGSPVRRCWDVRGRFVGDGRDLRLAIQRATVSRGAGGVTSAPRTAVNVLFHYTAGPDLAARLAAITGVRITVCPERDEATLAHLLPKPT